MELTEHIEVVPGAWDRLGRIVNGLIEDIHGGAFVTGRLAVQAVQFGTGAVDVVAVPDVAQIASRAPGVGDGWGEVPGPVDAPITQGIKHWATSCIEGLEHGVVAVKGEFGGTFFAFVVAIVVLEVVDLVFWVCCQPWRTPGEPEREHTPQLAQRAASFSS